MQVFSGLQQGSPEWLAIRAKHLTASEAPAMLGASRFMTRDELLKQKSTGLVPEVDAGTQRRFDAGHRTEADARPLAEEIIGDDLYAVTVSLAVDGLPLLASFDGLTFDGLIGFEHKLWSKNLVEKLESGDIPPEYYWQLEQQILVGGLERVLFMVSDGTRDNMTYVWYEPQPGRREQLIAGWKQFQEDLATYTHTEAPIKMVAEPVESLPAVSVRVDGKLTIASNVDLFTAELKKYIERLPKKPATDQEFANAEAAVKALQKAQDACDREAEAMLAPFTDAESARRALADAAELCRSTRLALEKLVKQRKEDIKIEVVSGAREKLVAYIAELNASLNGTLMPPITTDFQGVIKGLRTIESLRSAVNNELARAKIEAKAVAETIGGNLRLVAARNASHLFPDLKMVCTKAGDDFADILDQRVAVEEQRLEQERQRARNEALEQAAAAQAAIERAKEVRHDPAPTQAPRVEGMRRATDSGREAIIEHQDEISRFLATVTASAKEKQTIRAYLVQFVAFQAANQTAGAAH